MATKLELFLELAQPDGNGCSDWVNVTEFIGRYKSLVLGNGLDWGRKGSQLRKKYNVEIDKSITPGNRVDRVRLTGFNKEQTFSQSIRKDICDEIRKRRCVMLGVNGKSENTIIEVDHKDGRKNDMRVSDMSTQRIDDFQPLCKAANDIKRQICKNCEKSSKRWKARNIEDIPQLFCFRKFKHRFTPRKDMVFDALTYGFRCEKIWLTIRNKNGSFSCDISFESYNNINTVSKTYCFAYRFLAIFFTCKSFQPGRRTAFAHFRLYYPG